MSDDVESAGKDKNEPIRYGPGLSGKLLLLTIVFVMVAEVLVFVPSVSNFRRQWLMARLEDAQIAALAAEAAPGGQLPKTLRDELLQSVKVKAVAVKRADSRRLILEEDMPAEIDASYDLRDATWLALIADALMVYAEPADRVIRVVGKPNFATGEFIEVVMEEAPLKAAMIGYGLDILGLSILISIITAALVYLTLDMLLVKPMTKLTWNMVRFSERPEDPTRIVTPSGRRDEIGTAERELAAMQAEIAGMLSQKNRLAALGLAVSKISHDLRNMLSSAQLLSDRLRSVKDERVQQLVPKLLASLDRAIRLCARTLDFGQAQETPPKRKQFELAPLVAEVGEGLGLPQPERIEWISDIPAELKVDADRDQLFRVLEQSLPQRRAGAGERRRRHGRDRDHRAARGLGHLDRRARYRARRVGAGEGASLPGVPERGPQRRHRTWARDCCRADQRPWRPDHARQQRRRRHLPRDHPRRGGRASARAAAERLRARRFAVPHFWGFSGVARLAFI